MPSGMRSNRVIVGPPVAFERTSTSCPTSRGSHIRNRGAILASAYARPPRAVLRPQVVDFLQHLSRHLKGSLLVIPGLQGGLARLALPSQSAGEAIPEGASRAEGRRVAARLSPATEPGGICVGSLEER